MAQEAGLEPATKQPVFRLGPPALPIELLPYGVLRVLLLDLHQQLSPGKAASTVGLRRNTKNIEALSAGIEPA